jgi:hypothetical protein
VLGLPLLPFGRFWVPTALGLVWLALSARPALAQGCHVPERPTLGFSTTDPSDPFDVDSLLTPKPSPGMRGQVHVIPRPCTGDVARGAVRQSVAVACAEPRAVGACAQSTDWILAPEPRLRPLEHSARIDRPPRSFPVAA